MPKFNDFDLTGEKWRDYEEILTDSLWIINERDKKGKHSNFYHGNFIPQIPNQLIQRYTKKGDWVLDPFLGSGTTAIECENLERNIIGVDIQQDLVERCDDLITSPSIKKNFICGDSGSKIVNKTIINYLQEEKEKAVDFALLHPPYFDIIKFSKNKEDLSNADSLDAFLLMFYEVLQNGFELLKKGGYMAIVIGDKYQNSEWVPLGFMCMQEAQKIGFKLKSIVVKNMEGNRGKIGSGGIWRWRALNSDYYIFKHEYIFIFKK